MPDTPALHEWVGRTERLDDALHAFALAALAATLDRAPPLDAVPPLWHWLYFLPVSPLSQAGPDGHPQRGGFLPPVALPRRMWAGGRLSFHVPMRPGSRVTRHSTIEKIEDKTGRTGRLVFVTVRHRIDADGVLCVDEAQDLVYRAAPGANADDAGAKKPKPPEAAPRDDAWSRVIDTNPVLLFRYSALTFNCHRIHYDHPYATQTEGYPGLVVHGPLIATLLAGLAGQQMPGRTMTSFSFRAVSTAFSGRALTLCGRPCVDDANDKTHDKTHERDHKVDLWAKDHEGFLVMRATATLA